MRAPQICPRTSLSLVATLTLWQLLVVASAQAQPAVKSGQSPPADATAPETRANPDETPPSLLIQIPDEPRRIDTATLVPPPLAKSVTVEFDETPLRDVAKWLRRELQLEVIIDNRALAENGLLIGEPISDVLRNAPVYLLLNRLRSHHMDWYFEDGRLTITSEEDADDHNMTIPYPIGDLLDSGYNLQSLIPMLSTYASDQGVVLLGDVVFVRATSRKHIVFAGLIAVLRHHGRHTWVSDPEIHAQLRENLSKQISVAFVDMPLKTAVREIGKQLDADIRLDETALDEDGILNLTPVTLHVDGQPGGLILRRMLAGMSLTWIYQDGVVLVTSVNCASEIRQTMVCDVRDLCRNQKEANALMRALQIHTGGQWQDADSEGGMMYSPKPGVLLAQNDAQTLESLIKLLESYRAALRVSKPRPVQDTDLREMVTRYYRMQSEMALDLQNLIPELVEPQSWKSLENPNATGTIRVARSTKSVVAGMRPQGTDSDSQSVRSIVVPNSVLIIHQSRQAHDAIAKVIQKVTLGDQPAPSEGMTGGMGGMGGGMGGLGGGGMGGMGGGMGGFGGGFFSIPESTTATRLLPTSRDSHTDR